MDNGGNAESWALVALACDSVTALIVGTVAYHALKRSFVRRVNRLCRRVKPSDFNS